MKALQLILIFGPLSNFASNAIQLQNSDVEEETKRSKTLICPSGFFLLGRSCYAFGDQYIDWDQSQTECGTLTLGGRLIEIETEDEFYLVMTYLRDNPPPQCNYWIGAEERETSNYFQWMSSRWPVLFYNWYPIEPNSSSSGDAIGISCNSECECRCGVLRFEDLDM
ncbi:unnamed protein product [Cyprideis torosa]|uniref:Uncharacterized protein n=1 Tax=Cyprideis torosa TaxID=163714 RepID=A0A7R8ZRH8_9CRUS|nr:unnamed protein product [Cyprideis torosa]CAG0893093.1 unnamed protein product [Cyprideis torosa]